MAIWGHDTVHVEKDALKREWRVSTARAPRQHLVTIPWADAFRVFTTAQEQQYGDYIEAIATCQSHRNTALTQEEEQQITDALTAGLTAPSASAGPRQSGAATENVVSMDEFRRRKK